MPTPASSGRQREVIPASSKTGIPLPPPAPPPRTAVPPPTPPEPPPPPPAPPPEPSATHVWVASSHALPGTGQSSAERQATHTPVEGSQAGLRPEQCVLSKHTTHMPPPTCGLHRGVEPVHVVGHPLTLASAPVPPPVAPGPPPAASVLHRPVTVSQLWPVAQLVLSQRFSLAGPH